MYKEINKIPKVSAQRSKFTSHLLPFTSFVILIFTTPGCAKLEHLDQLLTLKDYSDEKDAQHRYVNEHYAKFQELVKAVNDGSVTKYTTQTAFRRQFGDPVIVQKAFEGSQVYDIWLYRHPIQSQAKERVYLYFDPAGKFVKFNHTVP